MICMERSKKNKKAFIRRVAVFFLTTALLVSVFFPVLSSALFPFSVQAVENDGGLSEHVIDTISPAHVKFNLFDYWMVNRDTPSGNKQPQGGINHGHAFVFGSQVGWGPWNVWTGNASHYNAQPNNPNIRYGIYPGIVADQLQNGYPALTITLDHGGGAWVEEHGVSNKLNESLAYLFDPDIQNNYKAVYENVQGLVKYDGNGGYIYNSHQNYAFFHASPSGTLEANGEPSAGYFDVYDNWALHGSSSPNGQFFPFDGAGEVFAKNSDGSFQVNAAGQLVPNDTTPTVEPKNLNHYMGLTMETVFLQPEGRKIDTKTPMSFTFSGDIGGPGSSDDH